MPAHDPQGRRIHAAASMRWGACLLGMALLWCVPGHGDATPQRRYFHPTKPWQQLSGRRRKRLARGTLLVQRQKRSGRQYFRGQALVPCRPQQVFGAFYDMKQASALLAGKPKMEKRRKLTPETWLIRTRVKVLFSTVTTHLRMTFFRSKQKIESVLQGPHTRQDALHQVGL